MGVVEGGGGEGFWRISRANASFVVNKILPDPRFVQLIPESLQSPRVSMTRLYYMLLDLEQREDSPFFPTDIPPMEHASLEVLSR